MKNTAYGVAEWRTFRVLPMRRNTKALPTCMVESTQEHNAPPASLAFPEHKIHDPCDLDIGTIILEAGAETQPTMVVFMLNPFLSPAQRNGTQKSTKESPTIFVGKLRTNIQNLTPHPRLDRRTR